MKHYLLLLLLAGCASAFGQNDNYYILNEKDTFYCHIMMPSVGSAGSLQRLRCYDVDTQFVTLEKKLTKQVTTFKDGRHTYDRVPENPNKPNKYVEFLRREISGAINAWTDTPFYGPSSHSVSNTIAPGVSATTTSTSSGSQYGTYHFYVHFDGQFYEVQKRKVFEKTLLLKLKGCSATQEQLQRFVMPRKINMGTPEAQQELMGLIVAYNEYCGK